MFLAMFLFFGHFSLDVLIKYVLNKKEVYVRLSASNTSLADVTQFLPHSEGDEFLRSQMKRMFPEFEDSKEAKKKTNRLN